MGFNMASNLLQQAASENPPHILPPSPAAASEGAWPSELGDRRAALGMIVYDEDKATLDRFIGEHSKYARGITGSGGKYSPLEEHGEHHGPPTPSSGAGTFVLRAARSAKNVMKDAGVVITMLPHAKAVREVYIGKTTGLIRFVRERDILIDCSTIDKTVEVEVADELKTRGAQILDAPVSGGVVGAKAGTLTFMVGGPDKLVKDLEPLFHIMGKKIHHCGINGTGQIAKICNNLLLGISQVGVAEALLLGASLGADPIKLSEVINSSSGRCWASEVNNPIRGVSPNAPCDRDFKGGFASRLMSKDLGIAMSEAKVTGLGQVKLPLGVRAARLYKKMLHSGYSEKDFGSVYQYLAEESGKHPEQQEAVGAARIGGLPQPKTLGTDA